MTVLLLARNGETNWTRQKRWQGHGGVAERQLRELAIQARKIAKVVSDAGAWRPRRESEQLR